ncbi:autophagy protein 5 [Myotisia sp. PD_48]|nr:autophagy protein 5 [Myotisia sp. PD_48]
MPSSSRIVGYRSPFAPKYVTPAHINGFTLNHAMKFGTIATGFGIATGIFAVFFFGEVPRVRKDILMNIPVIGGYWERSIAPEDNICLPRLSYFPFLLPKLLAFFRSALIEPETTRAHHGWLSFEGVPLKWHYPVGLLYDLYAGAEPVTSTSSVAGTSALLPTASSARQRKLARQKKISTGRFGNLRLEIKKNDEDNTKPKEAPKEKEKNGLDDSSDDDDETSDTPSEVLPWKLILHFGDWPDQELVRLDEDEKVMHDAFINSVKEADFLRNGSGKGIMSLSKEDSSGLWASVQEHSPSLKVLQPTCPPVIPAAATSPGLAGRAAQPQKQTIGSALNSLIPSLFPSKRTPLLAKPVLHGAVLPMNAPLEEVIRCAAYGDGWLNIVVWMIA